MSDRNPLHLWPGFRDKYALIIQEMQAYLTAHHPGLTCKLVEGFRSAEYQHSLWEQGRSKPGKIVTYKDGYRAKSNHQSSLAADIGVFASNGDYIEDPDEQIMAYYGHLVRAQGLTWGGKWATFKDEPHAEWNVSDTPTYTAAHAWQAENGLA